MRCDFTIPHVRIDVMFGRVVTTEAHPAFSGARTHSNNTAEMTAMIEALSFLGPQGPVARDEQSCIYFDSLHAAGLCLGTIQARTHVQLALACQRSMIFAQRKLRLPCSTYMVAVEIWVMDVLTMPLHLAHSGLPPNKTLSLVGIIIILMHLLRVLLAVTTSMKFWNDYNAFDWRLCLFPHVGS